MTRAPKLATAALVAGLLVGTLTGSGLAAAGPAEPPGIHEIDRLVTALEGGWTGTDNDTPFGKMPFAALFEWQEDGSLYSHSPLNRDTWIDLRFARDADGRWILHQAASMEGLGTQRHSLAPSGERTADGLQRFVYEPDPGFLTIDLGVEDELLKMDVALRGKPHVAFRLARLPRAGWAELKREMQTQGELSPEEGVSILEVVSSPPPSLGAPVGDSDPIAAARAAVAAAPASAEARLALARELGAAINRDPANGPRFAFEMLAALQKAVELDPRLTAAYHGLVGYYLSAPPIAGGSVAKAEETARRLAEFDPAGGAELLARIAARTGSASEH